MKYSFRNELYDSMDDVLNDAHQDDNLYELYIGEALRGYNPLYILNAIQDGDLELATQICIEADDLIIQEIEEVEE